MLKDVKKKYCQIILLLLVLLLAGFLRFYNIQNVGLKFYDEGIYLIEGSWLNGDVFYEYDYLSPLKPLHSALVAAGLRIFGYHDYSGLVISAFFGTMTVLVIYLIGKTTCNWKTGILSALILAVVGLHIIYSRTVLSEVNMTFFFSLAVLLYALAKKTGKNLFLLLSGLVAGLAFETRYLAALFFLIPLITEVSSRRPGSKIFKNLSFVLLPFVAIFFVGWIFYAMNNVNYLQRIWEYIGFGAGYQTSSSMLETLITYGYFIVRTISPIILVIFPIGLYFVLKKRDVIPAAWFFVWLLFLLFLGHGRDRDLIPLLPPLSLIAAQGFSIFESKKVALALSKIYIEPGLAVFISVFLILVSAFYGLVGFMTFTSPHYAEVGKFLAADSAGGVLSDNPSLVAFYTHKPAEYLTPVTKERLVGFSSRGFSHVVVESESWDADLAKIGESCEPVRTMTIETLYYRRVYGMDYESWWYKMVDWAFKKLDIPIKKYTDKLDSVTAERAIQIYRLGDVIRCL
jgi:4-amino-4-deoxy-L-arabinose transferase-like glycosyltransferase